MTALLSRDGTDFTLACDGCGQRVAQLADVMHHWDLAWGLLRQHGWTGAPLATGPHTCPRCTRASPPTRIIEQAPNRVAPAPARRRSNRITTIELPVATVVEVRGEMNSAVTADLCDVLLQQRPPRQHVVVDLSAASMPDCDALDVLVRAQAHAEQYACEMCLVGLSDTARAALRLLCLDQIWPAFADRTEALAWLRSPTPDDTVMPGRAAPAERAIGTA